MKGPACDPIGHILFLSKYNYIVTYAQVYLIFIEVYKLVTINKLPTFHHV